MEELTLGANLPLTDLKRLQWKTKDYTTGKAFLSTHLSCHACKCQFLVHHVQIIWNYLQESVYINRL